MLNKSIKYCIENKLIIVFAIVLVSVFGATTSPFNFGFSFFPNNSIAVDAIPNVGENQQIVFTEWVGQSPQDIEDQITYPLTSNLLGIPGVKSIRSSSMFGFSTIYIIFEDNVDFYWSRSRILEKLNVIPTEILPLGVQPQLGPDATALGQIFWYTLEGRDEKGEVTGGWSLQELRSIQDFYVKNGLAATNGVSEVASVGGFVKEYQIDVEPELMRQYGIALEDIVSAVKASNRDGGAQTIEINKAEYFVRGLGYINSIEDIENTSVVSHDFTAILLKDVAKVSIGPAARRGILDKGGAEVVGGVVTSTYGANPMKVLESVKEKIKEISIGLPEKTLSDGSVSKLHIVPFYDRSDLINATLNTLSKALWLEILITFLVVIIMLRNLKVALLISGLMPLTVLVAFVAMKIFKVDANIVALSGIAIAIGTIVDMGIILSENIVRLQRLFPARPLKTVIFDASKEVSGAIVTAGLTTIVSFIPVFSLTGVEGKLFMPLAFTKTAVLCAAIVITVFVIPPIATYMSKNEANRNYFIPEILLSIIGLIALFFGMWVGLGALAFGIIAIAYHKKRVTVHQYKILSIGTAALIISIMLATYWRPLGIGVGWFENQLFVLLLLTLVLLPFYFLNLGYEAILKWILEHKFVSIVIPIFAIILGSIIFFNTGKEFMPRLDEGDFLLMPSSLPHAGIQENKEILKKLDMAVAALPEVNYAVGKAGRTSSALDPAPLSMYENLISYKPEYILDEHQNPVRFKVNSEGQFETVFGTFVSHGTAIQKDKLVRDKYGEHYRNWREHIRTTNDIWDEIIKVTRFPGVTSAPKLQPIETRMVMLQTGMRSRLGIKVKGQNHLDVEKFGLQLEQVLKSTDGILSQSVFAERVTGKPYLLFDIDREKIARYGLSIENIQRTIEVAVGGKVISEAIEGRERFGIRVRYPRELRNSPEDLATIYVDLPNDTSLPISEFVTIRYEKGPQNIKSEDGFLVGYVIFDKEDNLSEVSAVMNAKLEIEEQQKKGNLKVPKGVSFEFSGTYKNHLHAQRTLGFVVPLSLALILVILYMQFKSISTVLIVFSSITVAFAGGFILIWFYGQTWFMNFDLGGVNLRDVFHMGSINLSVAVWVGFIALFGIASDDGVVMATYLKQSFTSKEFGDDVKDIRKTVIKAAKRRVRPCLMTTATTILALLPILTASGKGANILIPMAIPCLGGMLAVLMTLFVVPLLYCWRKELLINKALIK